MAKTGSKQKGQDALSVRIAYKLLNGYLTPRGVNELLINELNEVDQLEADYDVALMVVASYKREVAQLEESLEVCSQEILRLEAKERELEEENERLLGELQKCHAVISEQGKRIIHLEAKDKMLRESIVRTLMKLTNYQSLKEGADAD